MALVWKADLTQANCVLAGFADDSFQRQNGAGTFNDNTVPWPMVPVTAPTGRTGFALQHAIPANYRRYEVVAETADFVAGDNLYFGQAFYLPTGFPTTATNYQVIEQIRQSSSQGSPVFALEILDGALKLTGGWGIDGTTPTRLQYTQTLVATVQTGVWYNIVYRLGAFSTAENTSTADVWVNGTQVLTGYVIKPPTLVGGGSYRKTGIYHDPANPAATIYQAGHAIGTTYADVDPAPSVPAGRNNLLPNPALAVDATGWSSTTAGGGAGTAARAAVTGMARPWAYQYVQTTVGQAGLYTSRVPVIPGMPYSGTIQFRSTVALTAALVTLTFYNASGTFTSSFTIDALQAPGVTANVPVRLGGTRLAPTDAATCGLSVLLTTNATTGTGTFAVTAARIEQSDDDAPTYADGDTSGWFWTGTAGASPSRNPAGLTAVRFNSVTNPYLATDATGWAWWKFNGVASPVGARTSVTGMDRTTAYRVTSSGVHDFAAVAPPVAVTPGQWYSMTAQARFSAIPETVAGLCVVWLKSDNSFLSANWSSEQSFMTANVPYRSVVGQFAAPATAAYACVGYRWTTTASTPTVDVTAARLDPGFDRSLAYADGLTSGWVWDGAAGTSTSRSVPLAPVLPGYAASTESALAASRAHARTVNAATGETDTATPVGRLRGGALVETLIDTFEAPTLDPQWTNGGGGITNSRLYVPCSQNAGAPVFANVRSTSGYAWSGSALLFEVAQMPGVAGTDAAFAQMWIMDPAPANTVDRLGFEYRVAANALDLIGQSGAGYAPIGTTTTLTYSAATHRWLRITHTGSSVVWATSPDGLTWTTQRTLATPPTWTSKTTLLVSFEAYRTSGTNDLFLLDSVNIPPLRIVRPVRALSAVGRSYSF